MNTAVRASELMQVPLRLVSLVALDPQNDLRDHRDTAESARERARNHAQDTLDVARAALPAEFPIEVIIADGSTVESAVRQLDWQDGDLVMVGSSRLAQPRKLFLARPPPRCCACCPFPWS